VSQEWCCACHRCITHIRCLRRRRRVVTAASVCAARAMPWRAGRLLPRCMSAAAGLSPALVSVVVADCGRAAHSSHIRISRLQSCCSDSPPSDRVCARTYHSARARVTLRAPVRAGVEVAAAGHLHHHAEGRDGGGEGGALLGCAAILPGPPGMSLAACHPYCVLHSWFMLCSYPSRTARHVIRCMSLFACFTCVACCCQRPPRFTRLCAPVTASASTAWRPPRRCLLLRRGSVI
jgi:hypothetical protein